MSPSYLSPGVYVEEVDRGTKPIESVGTAVAAFVGYTERAVDVRNGETRSLLGKPQLVTNWGQYLKYFGGFMEDAYTPDAVYGYFNNGGGRAYVVSLRTLGTSDDPSAATPARVVIPSIGDKPAELLEFTAKEPGPSGNAIEVTVATNEDPENPTFTVQIGGGQTAERFDDLTLGRGERNVVTVLEQSVNVSVKVLGKTNLLPAPGSYALEGGAIQTKAITIKDYQGSLAERTGMGGLEAIDDVTMIVLPDLMMAYQKGELDEKSVQGIQQSVVDYCDRVKYCFAILDPLPDLTPMEVKEWRLKVNYDSTRAALYYPWIEVADFTGKSSSRVVPPSGYVAGVYARVDAERGVHKAPANEIPRGALGLAIQVTRGEQDGLNPIGVNCIRSFPGRGIRVWGARTLSSDASWRYINVRRLFNMVEESIERGTQWVVFEPNDATLWARLRRDITAYLSTVWGTGALFGATPDQAFFVKCDAETNPPELRDLGQLVCEIGMAPVKPAEFVIFRIGQWAGPG
ncbi:MAG: phage tail sheath family protein [Anaerolineae bacterium]|nr:phage tail sheath family protein [Anaerolineae bacterium]